MRFCDAASDRVGGSRCLAGGKLSSVQAEGSRYRRVGGRPIVVIDRRAGDLSQQAEIDPVNSVDGRWSRGGEWRSCQILTFIKDDYNEPGGVYEKTKGNTFILFTLFGEDRLSCADP